MNETAEAHHTALTHAEQEWRAFTSKARQEHLFDKQAAETLRNEMEKWRDDLQKQYAEIGDSCTRRINVVADEGERKFAEIQSTYNERLGLEAPVKYWEERATSYLRNAIGFSIAAIVVASLAGYAVWYEVQALLITSPATTSQDQGAQFGLYAWRYAFVIATAAFLVWPIRILVRILLSSVHLRIDAKERATLAETYLSLLKGGHALDKTDRRLILEILFRPATTGIVSDDAAPASMLHLLSRLGSGDKK